MDLGESSFVNGLLTLLKTARLYASYFYDLDTVLKTDELFQLQ